MSKCLHCRKLSVTLVCGQCEELLRDLGEDVVWKPVRQPRTIRYEPSPAEIQQLLNLEEQSR